MTITARIRDECAADEASPSLLSVARVTAFVGGPLFLVSVVLHPARDGIGVHAAGAMYGITHALQAFGLLLQAICLVSV
jgi:ribosomal protein S5